MYRGKGTSRLIAGGDHEMGAEGLGQSTDSTDAKRLEQVRILYDQMRQKADRLEQEVKNLKKGKKLSRDLTR